MANATKQKGFRSHWLSFVGAARWFSVIYLLLYVAVPFIIQGVPVDELNFAVVDRPGAANKPIVTEQPPTAQPKVDEPRAAQPKVNEPSVGKAKSGANIADWRRILAYYYAKSFGQPWAKDAMTAIFPVALLILSMWYGGILTEFYSTITQFGIFNVSSDRRGQDSSRTPEWIERISRSREVIIVGTLSQGWFVKASHELDEFLLENKKLKKFSINLLDPFGTVWRSRIEMAGLKAFRQYWSDVFEVLNRLAPLLKYPQVKLHFYDSEPISCVVARGMIYLGLYLPRTDRKDIPELTISVGSFLGEKIFLESVERLADEAPQVDIDALTLYSTIMREHASSTAELFWNDPRVTCDFCKECSNLPSRLSRRYPPARGARMISQGENFMLAPTLGPLVEDHALLLPTTHVTSSARLEEEQIKGLFTIIKKWTDKIAESSKTPLIFEHGIPSESSCYGGCGVSHCHLHLLALNTPHEAIVEKLEAYLVAKGYSTKKREFESWENISELHNSAYLALKLGDNSPIAFVFKNDEKIESQFMRKFLAEEIFGDAQNWDWRVPMIGEAQILEDSTNRLREMLV